MTTNSWRPTINASWIGETKRFSVIILVGMQLLRPLAVYGDPENDQQRVLLGDLVVALKEKWSVDIKLHPESAKDLIVYIQDLEGPVDLVLARSLAGSNYTLMRATDRHLILRLLDESVELPIQANCEGLDVEPSRNKAPYRRTNRIKMVGPEGDEELITVPANDEGTESDFSSKWVEMLGPDGTTELVNPPR